MVEKTIDSEVAKKARASLKVGTTPQRGGGWRSPSLTCFARNNATRSWSILPIYRTLLWRDARATFRMSFARSWDGAARARITHSARHFVGATLCPALPDESGKRCAPEHPRCEALAMDVRYRVWEVNRKMFLWPENWLEPEFRDDKTHLFRELEGALLQGDVSDDLVRTALHTYLKGLEGIARLEMMTMYFELERVLMAQPCTSSVARRMLPTSTFIASAPIACGRRGSLWM